MSANNKGYGQLVEDTIILNETNRATVVVQQPSSYVSSTTTTTVISEPRIGIKNSWSSDVCDCCKDVPGCCLAMFFWNCYLGCVAKRMGEHCCIGCCLSGLWPMRAAFRERHNIEGSMCNDACSVFWCGPCVACQLDREMTKLNYEKGCC